LHFKTVTNSSIALLFNWNRIADILIPGQDGKPVGSC
jgi:hypothetical protein